MADTKESTGKTRGLPTFEELTRGQQVGVAAAAGALSAITAGGDGTDKALAAAGTIASFLPMPYNFVAQLGISLIAGNRERKKARQQRIQQVKDAISSPRSTGLGVIVPLAYGECAVPQVNVYYALNAEGKDAQGHWGGMPKTTSSLPTIGTMTPTFNDQLLAKYSHITCDQSACGVGDLDGLRDCLINGDSLKKSSGKYAGIAIAEFANAGVASELATHFTGQVRTVGGRGVRGTGTGERSANSVGENLAKVTVFLNWLNDGVRFTGPPEIQFVIGGRKLRRIEVNGGVYSLSASRTYTRNAALVLLDFILDDVVGLAWEESDIDLAKWYVAQQRCDEIVLGAGRTATTEGRRTAPDNPLTTDTSSLPTWLADLANHNFDGSHPTDDTSEATTLERRYEFNGYFDAADEEERIVAAIMGVMPGAIIARGAGGLYLDVPDYTRTAMAQRAGAGFSDAHLLSHVQTTRPSTTSLATDVRCEFDGINKGFAKQGVRYPAMAATRTALEDRFGGAYKRPVYVRGASTHSQAFRIAGSICAMSVRNIYQWDVPLRLADYYAGQSIPLVDAFMGVAAEVRILTRRPISKYVVRYTALDFVPEDYGLRIGNRDEFVLEAASAVRMVSPASLTAMVDGAHVKLTWPAPDVLPAIASYYEIQSRATADDDWEEVTIVVIGSNTEDDVRTFLDKAVPAGTRTYRIRVVGRNGAETAWVESDEITVSDAIGTPGLSAMSQLFAVNLIAGQPDANSEARLVAGSNPVTVLSSKADAVSITKVELGITSGTAAGTVRRRQSYGGMVVGDIVSVRDGKPISAFADYEVTAIATHEVAGVVRRVDLDVAHRASSIDTATENPVVVGISRAKSGNTVPYFQNSVAPTSFRAVGPSVAEATQFVPPSTDVEMVLIDGDDTRTVTVRVMPTETGVTASLHGADADRFEIVEG